MIAAKSVNGSLKALLSPESVAVIGASRDTLKVGHKILKNLIHSRFKGRIYPVNPSGGEILGLPVCKTIKDCGAAVDHAVIVIPRQGVLDAVAQSLDAGAKAITVITAGFKEQDAQGAELEKQLVALCGKVGVRVLGPNCLGLLNTQHCMDISFGKKWPQEGNIAFISQSGALCSAVLDRAVERGFGLSKMISIGNKADVGEKDLLNALADDPATHVIVAYLEGINDGPGFMAAAEETSRRKPVVIFKSGVTASGSKAASSHTGSLAGADVSYEAAFKRCGVVRVHTYEQMFEFAGAFAFQPLPAGRRVAVITNAGGPGIMATDAIELAGLTMAKLSDETTQKLKSYLPAAASVKNPIDVLGDAAPERYVEALRAAQADPNVDATIVLLTPQAVTLPIETAEALCRENNGRKPVLACFLGGEDVNPARAVLLRNRLPDYRSPEKAANVLKAMCDYAEWRKRPESPMSVFQVNRERAESIIQAYRARNKTQINEVDAKEIFRSYGIGTAPGVLATSADDAGRQAEALGYPLVMKIVSEDVVHKSDVGGVKLNLGSRAEVVKSYRGMIERIRKQLPDARIDGVYLERMAEPGGLEVIMGMTRDPQFGPLLMFGLGGIFVEVLKDVAFRIAPVSPRDAGEMIRSIKAYPVVAGVRGKAGVDAAVLSETLQRLGQLSLDFPEIKELDINPFIARKESNGCFAADARITLLPERAAC